MIKTFLQWAEENKLTDVIDENNKRTTMTANYPELAGRGQYPKASLVTHKATAFLDLEQKPNPKYGGQRAAN